MPQANALAAVAPNAPPAVVGAAIAATAAAAGGGNSESVQIIDDRSSDEEEVAGPSSRPRAGLSTARGRGSKRSRSDLPDEPPEAVNSALGGTQPFCSLVSALS